MILSLLCAEHIGRFDAQSMSDQTLLELFVSEFKHRQRFVDNEGEFKDIADIRGIQCSPEGHITVLDFGGHSPPFDGVLNFCYFPPQLRKARLWENRLTGEFVAARIPSSTTVLFLGRNMLKGSIAIADLSDSMVYLSVFQNLLSGTLCFDSLPKNLIALDVSDNKLFGSLDLTGITKELGYDLEDEIADIAWREEPIENTVVYLDFRVNAFVGEVKVRALDHRDMIMFEDTKVTAAVDSAGERLNV